MNSKDQAVSCPLERGLQVNFSHARRDLTTSTVKIYTELTVSKKDKDNYLQYIMTGNSFYRISSGLSFAL